MNNTISITGIGIICAIGNDAPSVLDSLRERRSGIGAMQYLQSKHRDLPVGEVKLSNDEMRQMLGVDSHTITSRTSLMGAIAIREALASAGITTLEGRRVALISGTTVGGMDTIESHYDKILKQEASKQLFTGCECGNSTRMMAEHLGLDKLEMCTISTACSSALNSIIVGAEMLKRNEVDVVIAGGAEALSRIHFNGFNTLMILDKEQCRPFDATRAGLNLGEGAAFVVLECGRSDAKAYVAGYGNRCDAFHQTASSEDGKGAYLAMSDALAMARLKPDDIAYINAHGTGTLNNDMSESQGIKRLFGDNIPEVSSTKSFTGHTTSASGSIESVIAVLAMQNDFTPANLGWANQDANAITPTMGRDNVILDHVLCNSFGFGGNDSSLILSKHPVQYQLVDKEYECEVVAEDRVESVDELSALREYISPLESRRMGKLMRAAHLSALRAMDRAQITCPDAIITATARGLFETNLQFLDDIFANDEELLKPTIFMQSTHNTISSAIAIRCKCHGYNTTYSHGEESIDWAMRDAKRLIATGKAQSVLVVEFDESVPFYTEAAVSHGMTLPKDLYARSVVLKRK